jgi:YHS domain-containing protein
VCVCVGVLWVMQVSKLALPIQQAIKKPSPDAPEAALALVVSYVGRKYRFMSEEKLERFMMTPWSFTRLRLPVKLPLQAPKVSLGALPLVPKP